MFLLYLLADIVKPEFVIYLLQKQVASVVAALFAFLQQNGRIALYHDGFPCLLFCPREFRDIFLRLSDGVFFSEPGFKLLNIPQTLDIFGGVLAVFLPE